jgi:hypothetical protein
MIAAFRAELQQVATKKEADIRTHKKMRHIRHVNAREKGCKKIPIFPIFSLLKRRAAYLHGDVQARQSIST